MYKERKIMNKKELMEAIKDLDDDMEIITVSNNYELNGSYVEASVVYGNYKKVKEDFVDDFDHNRYSTNIFKHDINGGKVLIITG